MTVHANDGTVWTIPPGDLNPIAVSGGPVTIYVCHGDEVLSEHETFEAAEVARMAFITATNTPARDVILSLIPPGVAP